MTRFLGKRSARKPEGVKSRTKGSRIRALTMAVEGLEQGVLDDDLVAEVHEGVQEHHRHEGQEAQDPKQPHHGLLPLALVFT
jgi:hypothetical protein